MNETLEAIARTMFKSWFVDFDPVREKEDKRQPVGMNTETAALFPDRLVESQDSRIPEGWTVNPFSETVEIIGGGTPKTSVEEYWNGDIGWFSIVDAPNNSDVFVIRTEKRITPIGLESCSSNLLAEDSTIISARGTVGKVALVGTPMAINQSCYALKGRNDIRGYYTYFLSLIHI